MTFRGHYPTIVATGVLVPWNRKLYCGIIPSGVGCGHTLHLWFASSGVIHQLQTEG